MDKLRSLSTNELKKLLKERGLSQSCKVKEDLVQRLYEFFASEQEEIAIGDRVKHNSKSSGEVAPRRSAEESDESEENFECAFEETAEEVKGVSNRMEETAPKEQVKNSEISLTNIGGTAKEKTNVNQQVDLKNSLTMTENNFVFKDVEESLEAFSGETGKDVISWTKEFEDIATVCSWNNIQKYLYARRLLKGAAKLAVEASTALHSWQDLKSYLVKEFGESPSAVSVHRSLENRKKRPNETYLEYLYAMKQIANRGTIDEKSVIVYIVEGIQDEIANKLILYEAKNLDELKEKLKIYEAMKAQKRKNEHSTGSRKSKSSSNKSRCGNCGVTAHPTWKCPHKEKGSKCFNCNEFGHIAPNCPNKAPKTAASEGRNQVNLISLSVPDLCIDVNIGSHTLRGIIDTGSDVTLIRESVTKLSGVSANNAGPSIFLSGFGQNLVMTKGSILCDIDVQGNSYKLRCHIVPDLWMTQDILIGKDVLKDSQIIFEDGLVKIKRLVNQVEEDTENFWEKINVVQLLEGQRGPPTDEIANKETREEITKLIQNYSPRKPRTSCIQMSISLEDQVPVHQNPRRLAPKEKEFVAKQIKEWLDEGIIRESNSDFASPIVLAKKKDGSYRLCVDYRRLNKKIVRDRYPLPIIEEILENLYDARVFTTLDLKNGFFHVDISEESQKYTSFVTPHGQFEFLKVPFGLCNSPSVFQRFINKVFHSLAQKGVLLIYMDDIIIPSRTESENIEKLRLTLQVAEEHGLKIKWEKCKFLKRRIEFLGHIVENGSVKPSTEKIRAVQHFPQPRNLKQVQSFLGLTGFFRKFIPSYSIIAKPLSDLIKRGSTFRFDSLQQDAFNQLKQLLCSDPVLKLFNPSSETELHTDASRAGYGAVLLQKDCDDKFHPVFYLSYKSTDTEKNYSSYELEVLAIVKALKKLRPYLLGLKFKIYTDCKAFYLTMKKKELSSRVARWALILEEYDCSVHHRSGFKMRHADALSRYPTVYAIEGEVLQQIRRSQAEDDTCRLITKLLGNGPHEDFVLRNNTLYKFVEGNYLLVIPKTMQKSILRSIHEQGHINVNKVETLARQDYFIPDLKRKAEAIVSNCVACILAARKSGKQEGILNPIEKLDTPLHTLHVDHLGPLASTAKSYKFLFVMIDAFTKFCWIYPVKSTSSEEVIRKFEVFSEIFGDPHRIVADRGAAFTSNDFRSFCEQRKIQLVLVTTGVPRGNGQVERLNQTIISTLSKMSTKDPQKWYGYVPRLQQFLNSTTSRATGRTPFELMIGVKMRKQEDLELLKCLEEEIVQEFEDKRDEMRQAAKRQIAKIQEENKSYSLRKRKPAREYRVHDLVAIKRTQFLPSSKLYPKFLGPYEVTKIRGKDRYDVTKVGQHEGPNVTTSAADYMKPWSRIEAESSSEADEDQDGRV